MVEIRQICQYLEQLVPLELAEDWDNTGLLLGNPARNIGNLMTCLTVTPEVVDEVIENRVQMIVSHHPLMFRPVQKITTSTVEGTILLDLIGQGVAVYSPHTAFDSAIGGINQLLATRVGLENVKPLRVPDQSDGTTGAGRIANLRAMPLADFLEIVRAQFHLERVRFVGDTEHEVKRVAVACGSGGTFLEDAIRSGADALVTGEASFHTCLEAQSRGVALVLLGHFLSEKFALEVLAKRLQEEFPILTVTNSQQEMDPVQLF